MTDDGSVLPQGDIDAIFKQATGKDIVPPPPETKSVAPNNPPQPMVSPPVPETAPAPKAEPVAPSTPPVQTSPSAPSDDVLKKIQATLADLSQRIAKVEMDVTRFAQEDRAMPDVSVPVQRLSQKLAIVAKEVRRINGRTEGITRGLKNTPDYGIRNDFICEACGAHGFMAVPMRCTGCGTEGWWGWWPKKQ
jgi:hypothetical protein